MKKNKTLIDLFAGCGGLSCGLEDAGFLPVFVNELNEQALDTYLRNRDHTFGGIKFSRNDELHCRDISELTSEKLRSLKKILSGFNEVALEFPKGNGNSTLDIVAGGPPCQGYSGIGFRRSYSVDKINLPSNQLYLRMADVIESLRPRIFLFENVRGLLQSKWTKGGDKIWPNVLNRFQEISGYCVRWSLVKSSDYGVPQNRPRVLLVGLRNDLVKNCKLVRPEIDKEDAVKCGFLPSPDSLDEKLGSPPDLGDLLGDLVDPKIDAILRGGKYPEGKFETHAYPSAPVGIQVKFRTSKAGDLIGDQDLTEQEYSKHSLRIVKKFHIMQKNGGVIPEEFKTKKFSQKVLPARWGNKRPNLTVTSLPDDYVHFSQPRSFTVREWARLQFFPDWYQFSGKRTTGGSRRAGNPRLNNFDREVPKYTQIGNAVPVRLAYHLGTHFKKLLNNAFS